jgi:hypothetical protein
MFLRIRVLVMAAVALMACGTWVGAQMFAFRPVEPPVILSGNDVGFRIIGHDGTRPVGALVVRIDGRWVPVKEAPPVPSLATP